MKLVHNDRTPATNRLRWVVDVGYLALLVVCGARYFTVHPFDQSGTAVLVLAILSCIAYAISAFGPPNARRARWGVLTAVALWLPLVLIAPSFGWAAFAVFFAVFRVLPLVWAQWCAGIVVGAVCTALYGFSGGDDLGLVLGPLLGGIVLITVYSQLNRTLAQRTQLVTELVQAQAQLAEQAEAAGALTERTRVATELHDTVVQQTASALLMLEAATEPAAGQPIAAEPQKRLSEVKEVLRTALTETRQLMHGLTRQRVAGAQFADELRLLAESFHAGFVVEGKIRQLTPETEHTLLRVTQEALTNAHKHAAAIHTRVTLTCFDDAVSVDISDDGQGFTVALPSTSTSTSTSAAASTSPTDTTAATTPPTGYGLRAMEWRIQQQGGTLTVESTPGRGTVINAWVPLSPTPNEEASP